MSRELLRDGGDGGGVTAASLKFPVSRWPSRRAASLVSGWIIIAIIRRVYKDLSLSLSLSSITPEKRVRNDDERTLLLLPRK